MELRVFIQLRSGLRMIKGCVKVLSRPDYITVTSGVTAAFTNSQAAVCQPPANITFINNSTGPPTLSYFWDFGMAIFLRL